MHRFLSAFALFMLLASTSLAETRLSLSGGFSTPAKPQDFNENWTAGFGGSAGLSFRLSPKTRLSIDLAYSKFPRDDAKASTAGGSYHQGNIAFLTAHMGIRFLPTSTPEEGGLYIAGSAGFFRRMSDNSYSSAYNGHYTVARSGESTLSITAGLGILIPAGTSTNLFLEGRYGMAFTEGGATCYLPFQAGIEFAL